MKQVNARTEYAITGNYIIIDFNEKERTYQGLSTLTK